MLVKQQTADWVQIFFNYTASDIPKLYARRRKQSSGGQETNGKWIKNKGKSYYGDNEEKINEIYQKLKINLINLIWK